ncbi:MAG TPA: FAD/NAD(P)-binding protein [Vicinamibacterales bacterium]|nr:FAD/NAD(P)-binding protein [Vicinamibacterales bacterium]
MSASSLYRPRLSAIARIEEETPDTRTYFLSADGVAWRDAYRPGQFVELSVFGAGEAPFCLSQSPTRSAFVEVTVRRTGTVTDALAAYRPGDVVGLRGPFGNGFPFERARGKDLVFVGGGIGLPPLRSLINYVLDHRAEYGEVKVFYGARTPADRVYKNELAAWRRSADLSLVETVDRADESWGGHVGVVTGLLKGLRVDPASTVAFTCGPPVMLTFVMAELLGLGLAPSNILTTLERYMKCGVGKCGHCCVGHHYICVDGPVYNVAQIHRLPEVP